FVGDQDVIVLAAADAVEAGLEQIFARLAVGGAHGKGPHGRRLAAGSAPKQAAKWRHYNRRGLAPMKKQQHKNRLGWRQRLLWAVPGVALGWFVLVYWLDALQWPAGPLLAGLALASLAGAWLSATALPRLGAEGWLARRRKLPAKT